MSRMQEASGPVEYNYAQLANSLRQKPTIQSVPFVRLNPTATKDVNLAEHLETLRYGSFNV